MATGDADQIEEERRLLPHDVRQGLHARKPLTPLPAP